MAKISKRVDKSYEAYLKYRANYTESGVGLDRELTRKEYAEAHASFVHAHKKDPKKTHVAREIAKMEQTFDRSEASAIRRRLKTVFDYEIETTSEGEPTGTYSGVNKEMVEALIKKYPKIKDIQALQFSPEEAAAKEQERRQRLLDRGKEPQYTIQQSARVILFNELRDAGLSYKEADEVLYG